IVNKELAEYINSPSWDRPTLFNDNEEHSVQYKEYLENSSNEIAASNSNQEKEKPPQDFDIRQLIREECCIEVCRKQKQNMEDTMLELVEVCRQKEFYCMHNNVDDLIEIALNSKLLSINLKSQRLDKKKQEVKNVVEQPTKRGTRITASLQNFRVEKCSIYLNNTSQISLVHVITPVLTTKEPEYSLSMGYKHLSTILETESDEVIESSAKNLLPIPSEYEVTFDDESECDVPDKDESYPVFTTFSNPIFDCNGDFTSSDDESLSNEDDSTEDFKFDYLKEFSGAPMPTSIVDEERIRREHGEYISLMKKLFSIDSCPRPLKNFHANTIVETLPSSTILIEDSDSQREEIDASNFDHHDDLLFHRPPPEPPDAEFFFDLEPNSGEVISAVMNNIDELNEYECFDPGGEINVFENVEDDDYFPFIFVIRIFLPYLIYPEVSPLLLSAENEDTIFDPGISA
nr:hypothetical protein [Tanacetum cinerariifolium]